MIVPNLDRKENFLFSIEAVAALLQPTTKRGTLMNQDVIVDPRQANQSVVEAITTLHATWQKTGTITLSEHEHLHSLLREAAQYSDELDDKLHKDALLRLSGNLGIKKPFRTINSKNYWTIIAALEAMKRTLEIKLRFSHHNPAPRAQASA